MAFDLASHILPAQSFQQPAEVRKGSHGLNDTPQRAFVSVALLAVCFRTAQYVNWPEPTRGLAARALVRDFFVFFDFSVANVDDPVSVSRNVQFVSHQDDGVALLVEPLEQIHDFHAGG